MAAQDRFYIGQRVKLTQHALNCRISYGKPRGRVVGFSTEIHVIRVLRDGTTTPVSFHSNFWEDDPETPPDVRSSEVAKVLPMAKAAPPNLKGADAFFWRGRWRANTPGG